LDGQKLWALLRAGTLKNYSNACLMPKANCLNSVEHCRLSVRNYHFVLLVAG
jgi:hypothetical protein